MAERFRRNHIAATFACALICFCAAFLFDATAIHGHGAESRYILGAWTASAGALWAWLIYPRMGKSTVKDILIILIAFPSVGFLAGLLIGGGFPIAALSGAYTAVLLPFFLPWPIAVLYLTGALLAFWLPRQRLIG
jgi:hypothetical protein